MAPKVFISHAGEDKQRFVLEFAKKLIENGVNAWLAGWEMLPGDSLVDKIFEEGLKNAQAVVVVLSKNSVDKPWVREEINAAFVKRINEGSKLIPVVLDDCDVPECLRTTLWEPITDLNNYDPALKRILLAIYGQHDKPALGNPPSYAQANAVVVPGLTRMDSQVFKLLCDEAIRVGIRYVSPEAPQEQANVLGISEAAFRESLEVLHECGYIQGVTPAARGAGMILITIAIHAFERYAQAFVQDYSMVVRLVISQIVNLNERDSHKIAEALNQPGRIVDHILQMLSEQGLIKLIANERHLFVIDHSVQLRRLLAG